MYIDKKYLNDLADNEFKKYLDCLERAKRGIEMNNRKMAEHWLAVSKMALKQSAEYRTRRS